jgi:hypothetical protein
VRLNPDTYQCPTHQIDLTAAVCEALEEQSPPVAYGWSPFSVLVSCRGDGTSGAHQLACKGTYQP